MWYTGGMKEMQIIDLFLRKYLEDKTDNLVVTNDWITMKNRLACR